MIEINSNLIIIEGDDHPRQLTTAGIGKGENKANLQLDVVLELIPGEILHIVVIGLPKSVLGRHGEHLPLPR